ncbi:MAG: site-specific DNA-methyltransferase, partial [Chloroflexi bacterium]|nr:site-specific DNA-methyltransferase [Chloroflexota bacterium]
MVELIWDGKYDKDGKRVAPLRVSLPFQTVETVNESAQQRQRSLEFMLAGRDPGWRNRLIWGDKKYVLPSLLPEFAGKVDLIYIDPPFATGQDFSFQAQVGDERFTKEASIIEMKAYRDMWGGKSSLSQYLGWFYETAVFLHELLSETGSLYVHLDATVSHYAKTILDSIFDIDKLRNEIIWCYTGPSNTKKWFPRKHDIIFWYAKSENWIFNRDDVRTPYKLGRNIGGKSSLAISSNRSIESRQERMDELVEKGGKIIEDFWTDIGAGSHIPRKELTGYPTQKPEALLERIIRASSNEGDLVLDCFCGSGTTPAVAEKLKRRWIACDLGRFAVHTARKRLLAIENVRPFVVQNLGKYERQHWQRAEFGTAAQLTYRKFILDLYRAQPVAGYTWLHGAKGGRMVHVGAVDSPVAQGDVRSIAIEFQHAIGTG